MRKLILSDLRTADFPVMSTIISRSYDAADIVAGQRVADSPWPVPYRLKWVSFYHTEMHIQFFFITFFCHH